jgi:hypothetical protein
MAMISDIRKRMNEFTANLGAVIAESLDENREAYTRMNQEQMNVSMLSDGGRIEPPYRSAKYAKDKGRNYPDLKLTGAFQADMFFITDGEEFFLSSADEKTTKLVDKYGPKIFGIAPYYQPQAQRLALSSIARRFNKFVLKNG